MYWDFVVEADPGIGRFMKMITDKSFVGVLGRHTWWGYGRGGSGRLRLCPRKKAPQNPGKVQAESGIMILMIPLMMVGMMMVMVLISGKLTLALRRRRSRTRCKSILRKRANAELSLLARLESLGLAWHSGATRDHDKIYFLAIFRHVSST